MLAYLDNSATTKQHDFVTKAVSEAAENYYGNPSSLHRMGMEAEKLMRTARKNAASPLKVHEDEIYFTSGGTESNNTVLFGVANAMRRRGNHIITTAIEHPAVLECCKRLENTGFKVSRAGVDEFGRVDPEEIKSLITPETILVSVMSVNNELGTIQPLQEIGKIKSDSNNFLFHTDDVQGYGKLDLKPSEANIDFLSASAHKIHGPKGIGLLYVKKGSRIDSFMLGGGQEYGFRSGTENVPAAVGFGLAAEHAYQNMSAINNHILSLRRHLLDSITQSIEDIRINSPDEKMCLPGILNISFAGTRGEVLLHMLEQDGIFVSTGSACSSHKKGGSHVLKAVGLTPDEIEGAVRFSFSEYNTIEQMDYVADRLKAAVDNIRHTLKYNVRKK